MIREVYAVEEPDLCYEWSELHVYAHPADDDKFAIDEDGGCSCNYYERPPAEQLRCLTPLTATEAHAQISSWIDRHRFTAQGKAQELERAHRALRGGATP